MITKGTLHRVLAIGVLVVSVAASGAIGVTGASAAPKPHLVVAPSANLRNGEIVRVYGAGFKPKDTVYIVECLAQAKGAAQCDTLSALPAKITVKGLLPAMRFKVHTGKIGDGTCGTTPRNLKDCSVSVGNISGGDSAVFRIAFKGRVKK
ncbi:MAG: neocarzinostatin apoprotein domain-containing protein [Acidimicrobiales bacterium]